ncbi:MAG: hypothetical protein A2X23_11235, partial [Chloroflexi bacterium GWC2_73_18]
MTGTALLPRARILVVDDEEANVRILERLLADAGYAHVRGTTDPREVDAIVEELAPDLVLLDLHMPHVDGYELLRRLTSTVGADTYLPVLVLTADVTREAKERALSMGARDFLTKPFDRTEVLLRIGNLLETRYLYQALARENVTLHQMVEEQEQRDRERGEVERRVRAVLESRAIRSVYQPVVELASGRVVGAEALARFQAEPVRTPDAWFREADEVGLLADLERTAIEVAVGGFEELPAGAYLSLNVSPRTILKDGLAAALRRVPPTRVVLEVTEHAPIADYGALLAVLAGFRGAGGRLAVDDAGAGFASLRHILRLEPDLIKLDITLTRDIDVDTKRQTLAAGLIGFGREIGATIVAEGIETRTELETLR